MSIKTCEFVSPKHPDKMCDFVADSILDAYLAGDKDARVAIEVMGGHGSISVSGEISSKRHLNIKNIVKKIFGKKYHVHSHVVKQSPFIAQGVDQGGAGDQGIMVGFATSETKNLVPWEYDLARALCRSIYKIYPYDGKVQVTIDSQTRKVESAVASFQNTKSEKLLKLVQKSIKAKNYFINQAGEWSMGGFDADSGLSGRKIVIDNYGPEVSVGGGSFSGKDYTKVDRSGAYMARKIAVDVLKKHRAKEVKVKLAYVIGVPYPVMANGEIMTSKSRYQIPHTTFQAYDLTPNGIKKTLKLDRPVYRKTSQWGHFGNNFVWDK
ncbi:MAG: methionine adenosyltransferase domain-containing protein [Candidatus Doudnabacteria bacterium]|nr:methionine adenosyltransferase domain-containing protein [Candidatus Doudnabacteria bacterium]